MKRSGSADLPLHYGYVPRWLAERMSRLGLAVTESILAEYGKAGVLRRLSDPFWFQCLGAVMGMDWHSSGMTTSVMTALKKALNPRAKQLGIHICGGKGRFSRRTPQELLQVGERCGIDGHELARCSRLSAKVDNTAVQDGFQLYMHHFIVSDEGDWTVVQQGMRTDTASARRYHWHSAGLQSFVEEPHTGICGKNQGVILNLTSREAGPARRAITDLSRESPEKMLAEARKLVMPRHHDIRAEDIDLKRLGSILWLAHDEGPAGFEELLLLKGMGPRTLQSLTLVSEVIYGTPSRFKDPARFSFAHGGKDGHPFPVPLKVYDETINALESALSQAKIDRSDKLKAIGQLHKIARKAENNFTPNKRFSQLIEKERQESWKYGGRTVSGKAKPPPAGVQLDLFRDPATSLEAD